MANVPVYQERLIAAVTKDSDAQVFQERLVAAVTKDSNAQVMQERLIAAVTKASNARVIQERLIVAFLPGQPLGIMTLRQSGRVLSVPSRGGIMA